MLDEKLYKQDFIVIANILLMKKVVYK